jgi:hypothetical protein
MNKHWEGSQLFTLRVWMEEVGDGRFEMRGTIRHVLSGETHHFRDMAVLRQLVEQSLTKKTMDAPGGKS